MKIRRLTQYLTAAMLAGAVAAQADVITDWNNAALDAIRAGRTAPPVASRNLAILHVAMFDAVNGIVRTHNPYLSKHHGVPKNASVEAAASAAAHRVLSSLFPAGQANFDALHEATVLNALEQSNPGKKPKHARIRKGLQWGERVADAILEKRLTDGATNVVVYVPGINPGEWRPTVSFGGVVRPALLPQWATLAPFCLTNGGQFRPPAPPALTSEQYAMEVNQVKELGSKNSSARTADQSEIAQFWSNGAGTSTPPGHWNEIAQVVATEQGNSVFENAHLFALLNIAMADAAIVSWDCKYQYNLWRPITAIAQADLDNNPATDPDPTWEPYLETPPFPEYTSGHSTFSGAAATVLALFYNADDIQFTVSSDGTPGVFRHFDSFSHAAAESGISRIYGGIHFASGNVHGLTSGMSVGTQVIDTMLLSKKKPKKQGR